MLERNMKSDAAMLTAIALIDPVTDYKQVINAALGLKHVVIAVQLPDVALPDRFRAFSPTTQNLLDAGATHTLSMDQRDVFAITRQLQILSRKCNLRMEGVIPLSEVAVEVSDIIASCLGLPHNPLDLLTARRDKGLMKDAVQYAGLRIAKYARVGSTDDLSNAMQNLSLTYPIVVKTPSGMSTTDVFVCFDENDAKDALDSILNKVSPDGRNVELALLEEFIEGTEFAINLMSSNESGLLVTDMWKYKKTQKARYDSAEICNTPEYPELISYACRVANAVGIKYGAAHVELKARQDESGNYIDPIMIEIGARLSGGRKSIMAQAAIRNWDPFTILIKSHCGKWCQCISDETKNHLIPDQFARHIFLPIEKTGVVKDIQLDTSGLSAFHSSAIIVNVGDSVSETADIVSCAGFVWLVGGLAQVDEDTEKIRSSFQILIE